MKLTNDSVYFEVTEEGQVAFFTLQKDGEWGYEYSGKERIKNTRFLLKCFEKAKEEYPYLFCSAFKDDGYGDKRREIFIKLGFEYRGWEDSNTQFLEWGEKVTIKIITPHECFETWGVEKELRQQSHYWEVISNNPKVVIFAYCDSNPLATLESYLVNNPDSSYEKLGFIFN